MSETLITPYLHPTTVVLLDDNDLFLKAFDLRMPAHMACLRYHDPREAMERISAKPALPPIPDRWFGHPVKSLHWTDSVIQLDIDLIEQEVNNLGRFRRVSVVVADFAMPAVDGLTLLTSIKDPFVQTVLMSGAQDQAIALKAFNDGLIDRYIPKGRTSTLDLVVDYAVQLQRKYFVDQQRAIQESLSLNPPKLLGDREIARYLDELYRRHGFVEHYLVGDPPGFVLITGTGEVRRLLVLSDSEVSEQVEYAARNDAPNDVTKALAMRSKIGFFSEDAEHYGDEPYPWREHLYAPLCLEGIDRWWTALIADPPVDIDFNPSDSSFEKYLEEIDAKL